MAKYLIKTTEEHRADTEFEAGELINAAKADGEIIDEYYLVTLVKVFDDAKDPNGEASVEYKIGAF